MTAPTTPPTQQIVVNGVHIAHIVAGPHDGLPIVMMHGWGANSSLVWPLAQKLAALNYRVFVPDMPGFGASPEPPSDWGVFDYAKILLAYCDHLKLDHFALFGHSFGGRLGLILGADHSNRITKMILADAAGIRPKTSPATQIRLSMYKSVRDGLKSIGLTRFSDSLRNWYNARYGSADFNAVSGVMRQTFVNVVNEDLLPYAQRVKPSTLLLWGDQDEDTPLWQARKLEAAIPDAGLVVFPGAGHYSYLDALAESTRVIDYFLKQE